MVAIKSGSRSQAARAKSEGFVYDLHHRHAGPGAKIALDGNKIVGSKTFTYERRCNPWRQLMEVTLETFPG